MNKLDIIIIASVIVAIGLVLGLRLEALSDQNREVSIQTNAVLESQKLVLNISKSIQTVLDRQLNASGEQQTLVDQITELEKEVLSLKSEITVLKEEIATLKQELVESRIIISEQRENITSTE